MLYCGADTIVKIRAIYIMMRVLSIEILKKALLLRRGQAALSGVGLFLAILSFEHVFLLLHALQALITE